ncbi:glycosyltransferase [Tenacibaculum salmonis]|uniref:glycosyltransferase n=1 Tax=Tenacibaculum sp. P3-BQ1 TaxID=3232310 RepID=UPI0034E01C92
MFLSIIIPVYNTPIDFFKECLGSLTNIPSSLSHEVIIVNDGSTEKEILSYLSLLNKDDYTVIHKKNEGLGSARNTGINIAVGKYIYPLDSDDALHVDFKIFIEFLKTNNEIEVLYGDLLCFGDVNSIQKYPDFDKLTLYLDRNIIPACSFFKKRTWEKAKGYDESLKTAEDYDFWIQCAVNNAVFQYIPYSPYKYRIINNGESLFQKTKDIREQNINLIRNKIPTSEIKMTDINNFIKNYFIENKRRKKKLLGLLIFTFSPKLYKLMNKFNMFTFKENFL